LPQNLAELGAGRGGHLAGQLTSWSDTDAGTYHAELRTAASLAPRLRCRRAAKEPATMGCTSETVECPMRTNSESERGTSRVQQSRGLTVPRRSWYTRWPTFIMTSLKPRSAAAPRMAVQHSSAVLAPFRESSRARKRSWAFRTRRNVLGRARRRARSNSM